MKCSKCGKETDSNNKLCRDCAKKNSNRTILIIFLVIFILIGVFILLIIKENKDAKIKEAQKYAKKDIEGYTTNNNYHNEAKPYFIGNYNCKKSDEENYLFTLSIEEDDTYMVMDPLGYEYTKGKYTISYIKSSDIDTISHSTMHWYTFSIDEDHSNVEVDNKIYLGLELYPYNRPTLLKIKNKEDIYNCDIAS